MSAHDEKPSGSTLDDEVLEALREAYAPSSLELSLNERLIAAALSSTAMSLDSSGGSPKSPIGVVSVEVNGTGTAPTRAAGDGVERDGVERDGAGVKSTVAARVEGDVTHGDATGVEQAHLLAQALSGRGSHPLAELAEALRCAYAPAQLDTSANTSIASRVLTSNPRPNVIRFPIRAYTLTATAVAAGIVLWMVHGANSRHALLAPRAAQLVQSRSAAPMFAETFSKGTATQRIDRIYAVRTRELRQNRYATWSVR